MLLSKTAIVHWNSKIKKHYVDLGYKFTKMKDSFSVKVEDLTTGSRAIVKVRCDYCKKIYEKPWYRYLNERKNSPIPKDACTCCKTQKAKESVQQQYGCDNVFQLKDVKQKIVKTNLEKYGVDNPSKSEIIQQKIYKHMMDTYGVKSYTQTDEFKQYMRSFCLEKYGIPYPPQLNLTHVKGKHHPRWTGVHARDKEYRQTFEYRDWRKYIMQKDNFTCQCCGLPANNKEKIKIHVHHIFSVKGHPELIHDKSNGICLCSKCHYKFHGLYGFGNNTKQQFDEFILNHGKKVC